MQYFTVPHLVQTESEHSEWNAWNPSRFQGLYTPPQVYVDHT